jgi:predicted nucleotidyltransferase
VHKTIYRVKSGSQLYGLITPQSDVDYVSVFLPTPFELLSLEQVERVSSGTKSSGDNRRNTSDDIDDVSYSLSRFLQLALGGNPELTEIMFSPSWDVYSEEFKWVRANTHLIVSSRANDSFMGFAISQKKKLTYKKERYTQLCRAIEYLEPKSKDEPMSEETATYLNRTVNVYKGSKHNNESFHKGLPTKIIYDKLVDERDNYGWRLHTETFERLGYDTKFASHTLRLLAEGEELTRTGRISLPLEGDNRETIMSVKKGEVSLDDFYKLCTEWEDRYRKALDISVLPKDPNRKKVNQWLVDTLTAHIKGERICN